MTLVVDDIRAAGEDQILARVHVEGTESGDFLGRPVPVLVDPWGPIELWRLADGQLAERWGDLDSAVLLSMGQVPIPVDALGPGDRRVTVTRMTIEPGATFPVDNGQAIRMFAVEIGTLTVDMEAQFGGTVVMAHRSAVPSVSGPGTSITAAAGDQLVTVPEGDYTLANGGEIPVRVLVVIVSNTSGGEWPLNAAAAAASWTVAAMPEALGGVLPSPAGFSARVLVAGVEIEMPAQPVLALGWMFLAPGTTLGLPNGEGMLLAAVDEGWVELAVADGTLMETLAPGEWTPVPDGARSFWHNGVAAPATILMLTVTHEDINP